MKGLRTQDNDQFIKFFQKVQDEAGKRNAVFFLDFGEEKNIKFQDMELDDLFGWLVPLDQVNEFETAFTAFSDLQKWDDLSLWCISTVRNNELDIEFKSFE